MAETITRQSLREQVSSNLKLRFRGTASDVADPNVTVAELSDLFSEALAPRGAYLTVNQADFRRIIDFASGTGAVTLNRNGLTDLANTATVDVYLILTPADWNEIINEALGKLFFTDEVSITPVDGQSLYSLPAGVEWLQTVQQVARVVFRWTQDNWTHEQDAATYNLIQDANTVSINFGGLPADLSTLTIIVQGRHYYESLTTEGATTTCPQPLAKAQIKVEALRRIWSIMGEVQAKELFGVEMRQAEAELLDAKKQFIKQVQTSPLHVDRAQPGPDLAMSSYRW